MLTLAQKMEFKYSKSQAGLGKLQQVTDSIGNNLKIQRDYSDKVQFLENSYGQKYSTKLDNFGQLESVQISARKEVKFEYGNGNDFLLTSTSVSSGLLSITINISNQSSGILILQASCLLLPTQTRAD